MTIYASDAIYMVSRRLCNGNFRGKTVLFGGDSRQTPTVVF